MKEIQVTGSENPMLVDDDDFVRLSAFFWRLASNGYAIRSLKNAKGTWTTEGAHRTSMGLSPGDGVCVDHRNGVRLDNRKNNLRLCTNRENQWNQREHKDGSGYKGVCFAKASGKWQTSIKIGDKVKYLGQFETPELAHEFYCLAADMIQGDFANHRSR